MSEKILKRDEYGVYGWFDPDEGPVTPVLSEGDLITLPNNPSEVVQVQPPVVATPTAPPKRNRSPRKPAQVVPPPVVPPLPGMPPVPPPPPLPRS